MYQGSRRNSSRAHPFPPAFSPTHLSLAPSVCIFVPWGVVVLVVMVVVFMLMVPVVVVVMVAVWLCALKRV